MLASANVRASPCLGGQAGLVEHVAEGAALLGQVDGLGAGADDRHARVLERLRQPQRGLPAELDDDPGDRAGRCSAWTTSSTSSQVSGSK